MADQSKADKCPECRKALGAFVVPFDGKHPACAGKTVVKCFACKREYGDIGLGAVCPFCNQ